ncbi:protealysin inhibitor emfourin [Actinomycetospora lemnae]|uniref:Uncharacterized protein n=1 Tax=Actinomycetospora lemnae TaxID=3019891 RepID=A0ABT5T1N0_9PSEU|nr:protealysin inhibitor emfourin [Actinomycetospora sp. DW7H6]MDD7968615.1 hypothetical protein [Actinomycetospora sp. DW7H6]
MKVTVVRAGGVAGMVLTVEVDAGELDAEATAQLTGLVDACEFPETPPAATKGRADTFDYELAVERDDGAVRRTRFGQGAAPPGADALVAWVLDGPHGHRHVGRW